MTLVREGRERELRGIGPGISARLRELAETGSIAELDELRSRARPELVGLGRLLGIAPKRMLEIATALGAETPEDFRRIAREGSLQRVPGIGPATERRILERLDSETDRPRRGLTLPAARDLVGGIAEALGGEIAGDPRRWADLSFDLAVVVPTERPAEVLDAFDRLPQIVTVVERSRPLCSRGDGGGRAGDPLPAGARRLRHGPGAEDRRSGVRRRARAAARRGGRGRRVHGARHPLVPARAPRGTVRRRAAATPRARRRARRSPLPYDVVGRPRLGARDGHRRPQPRLRVPRDLRPHAERPCRPGPRRRRAPPAGRGDPGRQRAPRPVPRASRRRGRHPPGRRARPAGRRARRARLGAAQPPCGAARRGAEADGRR